MSVFEIMDIDSDGDLDIVTGNHQGDVYILKNSYPDYIYGEWNKFKVSDYSLNCGYDIREIDIGDIDNDGDLDVAVTDAGSNTFLIYFNNIKKILSKLN